MRLLAIVLCLVALTIAAPEQRYTYNGNAKHRDVIVLRFVSDYPADAVDEPYNYTYDLSDGSRRNEETERQDKENERRNQGRNGVYLLQTGSYVSDGSRRNEEDVAVRKEKKKERTNGAYTSLKTGRYSFVGPEGIYFTHRYTDYQPTEEGPGNVNLDILRSLLGVESMETRM